MYNIDIDWDVANGLVKTILQEDYDGICKDIEKLKNMQEKLDFYSDDLEFNIRIRDAMKIVFEYYFTDSERKKIINA
jgi:hypothetical protein